MYEAWDPRLCRSVALKRLKAAPAKGGQQQLIGEARLAASLQHTAFVKIFAFEEDGHSQSIVMELVQGLTLRDYASGQALEPPQALDIVDQIAAAMAEAHSSGLIHGDLKPNNLMLEPSGKVRILDFGLARQVDPLATQTGLPEDPLGTIAYMAPERLLGRPLKPASDIYSLGVVLYELIVGQRPFAALDGLALAAAHLQSNSDHWQFPASADSGTAALVRAMTARDPAQRMPSMAAVRERIAAIAVGKAPSAPPRARGAAALARARRAMPAACAALLGAGALLLALQLVQHRQTAAAAPFSQAGAMRAGLEALRVGDRDGAIDSALAHFGSIIAHRPDHAGAAAGLSLAYSMRYVGDGRDDTWLRRADASAQQALQANDQLAIAHAARAWVQALQGHGEAALAAAGRALELDPSDLSALNAKANVLLRMQRYDAAQQLIADAQARFPRERLFADLEGTMHYQRGDYRGAERAFRRSLQLEPDAVLAYANLSAALLHLDRGDEALQVLQQGLRTRPSGVLYSNLGAALFARADYAGAARAFEHAVSAAKGGPNDYLKWANLADTLRWIPGREAESLRAYRRAVQLLAPLLAGRPDDPTFLTRMGLYAVHLDDTAAAVGLAERGAAAAPDNPAVRFRAAVTNEIAGRRQHAIAHLARAKTLGYPAALIDSEPNLVALRRDSRYQTIALETAK